MGYYHLEVKNLTKQGALHEEQKFLNCTPNQL